MNSYGNVPAVASGVLIIGRHEIQELLTMPAALEAVAADRRRAWEGRVIKHRDYVGEDHRGFRDGPVHLLEVLQGSELQGCAVGHVGAQARVDHDR